MGRTGGGVFNTFHRRGSNQWGGSALVQSRPNWGVGQLYFAEQAGTPKPDTYYWTWAGSAGGPIVRDKTFFWLSTESYRTNEVVNTVLHLPTEAEARGDFSQSGATIYDPLTTRPDPGNPGQFVRDPFPGNVIPAERLNPVGLNLAAVLAARGSGDVSANGDTKNSADQFSFNLSHEFKPSHTLTGTYMYYDSNEPPAQFDFGGPSDPSVWDLYRQVHLVALNDTILVGSDGVVTLRYGYNRFVSDFRSPDFDVTDFGWSENYARQVAENVFPVIDVFGYGWNNGVSGGFRTDETYYSHNLNGTVSKFIGAHTLKLGADFRRLGLNESVAFFPAGLYEFSEGFTEGPDPNNPALGTGDSLATLLLGYPSFGTLQSPAPLQKFIDYYGVFVQDDWRVSDHLVLNLGLRIEHETGLAEKNNRLTVGFDRETPWPVQPIEGMILRGGLMYAGVDGYPEHQGDPTSWKWGPRAGFSWSLDDKTVLRGGLGLFWAPYQPTAEGARGFETSNTYFASNDGGLTPAGTITDPFPNGIERPLGSNLGLLTGAGGDIEFADQFRQSPYVQQYSIEVQRELPGGVAGSVGYVGSRSERLGIGGTSPGQVNINQLDPSFASLGPALQEQVPNPFFGNPIFGNLSENPTVARGQLLRPYPQFLDLYAQQMSEGKRRYHSLVLSGEKRFRGSWSFRVNYVFSRNDDNVFGEGSSFSRRTDSALNSYDLEREYGRSLSDIPHRLNISGIYELPFGRGKRWLDGNGIASAIFGGWSFSATGFYQSGFPVSVLQSPNNTGLFTDIQRPNVVPGVDAGPSGSVTDNLDRYLDTDAWTQAGAFTFGDAPRTDTRVRTPARKNWDIAFQKTGRIGRGNLSFRFEIINLFNTPSFTGPQNVWGRSNFGQITSVNGFPRLLQIGFRYNW
ncbi:MAG TPA: hypothetical protein VEK15_17940, partial [Vicinamibacteria bacterium]|nr:hypothetical protein [Vicinamibacteria bacterium]